MPRKLGTKQILSKEVVIDLFRTMKDENDFPIEEITATMLSEQTGAGYRTSSDILLRMYREGILEKYKDGKLIGYSLVETRVLSEDDIDHLFDRLVGICRTNETDPMCKSVLNNIVSREGGNMPDTTIPKDKNGNPKLHKKGKKKGEPIVNTNGGWGYLIRSTISVMGEYDLLRGRHQ